MSLSRAGSASMKTGTPTPEPSLATAAPAPSYLEEALRRVRSVLQARSCEVQQQKLAACVRDAGGAGAAEARGRCSGYVQALQFCEQQMMPYHHPNHPTQFMI